MKHSFHITNKTYNPVFWADPSGGSVSESVFENLGGTQTGSFTDMATGTSIGAGGAGDNENKDEKNKESDSASKKEFGENGNPRKTELKNTSTNPDHVIYFKPEGDMVVEGKEYKNGGAYPLKPGEIWEHGFDGVAAPHISKGSIFKASNGVSVTVSEKNITWSGGDFRSQAAMYLGKTFSGSDYTGGWKTESWLRDLTASSITTTTTSWKTGTSNQTTTNKKSDSSWINLFNKSGLRNAQDYKQSHSINRRTGGF